MGVPHMTVYSVAKLRMFCLFPIWDILSQDCGTIPCHFGSEVSMNVDGKGTYLIENMLLLRIR